MTLSSATAVAHPNIAFIKYWGNRNDTLRLPQNGSLSMNLAGLHARTSVDWTTDAAKDRLVLNGQPQQGAALQRVEKHLDVLRARLQISARASVTSENNFPTGAGIASSAAAFAALTVAGVAAAGQTLTERELTTLARLGSGSASRSVPSGFVEWVVGDRHDQSYAFSIAPPMHWDLVDVIAVVSAGHKVVGSTAGHASAATSVLQSARVAGAHARLETARRALLERDFAALAEVVEEDSNLMHAVMMTSKPPLFYWEPASLRLMKLVRQWREDGLRVLYTLDAGPNVHCICTSDHETEVRARMAALSEVGQIIVAGAGGPAKVIV
jgi:diphosphomevalonate decarboxylase